MEWKEMSDMRKLNMIIFLSIYACTVFYFSYTFQFILAIFTYFIALIILNAESIEFELRKMNSKKVKKYELAEW